MINEILAGLAGIQQAVDGEGEGLGAQVSTLAGNVMLTGNVTPNLSALSRVHMLNHVVLKQAAATIDMPLPSGFHLFLVGFTARCDYNAVVLAVRTRFNGDSAANYDWMRYYLTSGTPGGNAQVSSSAPQPVVMPGLTGLANSFSRGFLVIPHPTEATAYKILLGFSACFYSATATQFRFDIGMTHWKNTAPLDNLELSPGAASTNFVAGSQFTLWGMK